MTQEGGRGDALFQQLEDSQQVRWGLALGPRLWEDSELPQLPAVWTLCWGPGIMYAVQSESANQMTTLGTSCDDYGGCSEASLQEGRKGQGRRAIPQTGAGWWGFLGRRDRKSVWATRVEGVSSSTWR